MEIFVTIKILIQKQPHFQQYNSHIIFNNFPPIEA